LRNPPLILVVDDMPDNIEVVRMRLENKGYEVIAAGDGEEALATIAATPPDLVLLDVMMPKLDGIETLKRLKADTSLPFMPVVLLTAKADAKEVIDGLDSGADDYLTKPVDHAALLARVRAMLRIKAMHDTNNEQAARLAELNATLEARVATQVGEIERMGRLKRFLAPQVANAVLAEGGEDLLRSHRREVVVLFCDLRGFTAFAETAEPEEVMTVLREYHGALGPLVREYEGTLDHFAGDSIMVFFNDPVPCADPAARGIGLAAAIREAMRGLTAQWRTRGHMLGCGLGVGQGFATLGRIGFEDRLDYAAIGTVTNVAARLCAEAADDQILMTQRVAAATAGFAVSEPVGPVSLKGLARPIEVHRLLALAAPARNL
jgi:adenylate cyclase